MMKTERFTTSGLHNLWKKHNKSHIHSYYYVLSKILVYITPENIIIESKNNVAIMPEREKR